MIRVVLRKFMTLSAIEAAMASDADALFVSIGGARTVRGIGRGGVWFSLSAGAQRLAMALLARESLRRGDVLDLLFGYRTDGGPTVTEGIVALQWEIVRCALAGCGVIGLRAGNSMWTVEMARESENV